MSATDISIEPPYATSVAAVPRKPIFQTIERSLLVIVCAMTWATPVSSRLAINLFRVAVILWLVLAWDRRGVRTSSPIFLPLIVFIAITAFASLACYDRHASWQQMKVVELGFAAILVADTVRSLRILKVSIAGLLGTTAFAAVYGIGQSHAGVLERAQGFYTHYINFGEMLLLVALLSLGLLIPALKCARNRYKVALAFAFLAITLALAATGTRTFLAALMFGAAVIVWTRYGWKARFLTLGALVVALFASGWWLLSQRHLSWFDANDPGTQYRFLIWKDGARVIRQHPLLGVGFANIQRHPERFDMGAYRTFPNMISHFHSTPIEIAADCGVPALAIWIWLMLACWREAKRAARHSTGKGWLLEGTSLGILGAVAAFQLASLFHHVLGDPEPMLIFWSLVGSAIILLEQHRISPVRIPVDSH